MKFTVPVWSPADAEMIVGAFGTVAGVTLLEDAEATLEPIAFLAVTTKVKL